MVDITDQKAEQMRAQLAAHEARKAEEAAAAEEARKAEALAVINPVLNAVDDNWAAKVEELRNAALSVGAADWDITTLVNNCVVCMDSLQKRVERRRQDLSPSPAPAPAPAPAPEPTPEPEPS